LQLPVEGVAGLLTRCVDRVVEFATKGFRCSFHLAGELAEGSSKHGELLRSEEDERYQEDNYDFRKVNTHEATYQRSDDQSGATYHMRLQRE
jgi:hypothetical protein